MIAPMRRTLTLLLILECACSLRAQPVDPDASAPVLQIESSAKAQRAAAKSRLDLVMSILNGEFDRMDEVRFSENFVSATPRDEAVALLRRTAAPEKGFEVLQTKYFDNVTIGAWARSQADREKFITIRLAVEANQPHRIDRLEILDSPPPGPGSANLWRELDESLAGKPFRAGVAVMELRPDGTRAMIHQVSPDERLGIGTMGTIFTHLAVAELIGEGAATWDKKLAIDESLRSLPDTRTSRLPGGTELSLSQYSRRAMSEADNTCADHLFAHLGRERIEFARNRIRATAARDAGVDPATIPGGEPFLSVMENYRLKCGVTTLITRYAEASNDERRRLLDTEVANAEIHLTLLKLWKKPQELLRVGWTASPRELCEVGARLTELSRAPGGEWATGALRSAQQASPRLDVPSPTSRVAGEPGAEAALWMTPRADGRTIIAAIIFNSDAPLDETQTKAITSRALEIVAIIP